MRFPRSALALLFLALCVAGCFRQEVVTLEIRAPQVRNETAASLVRAAFGGFDTGLVHRLEIDTARGAVRVTYDSTRVARKNLEIALADAGFDANAIPADPEKRKALPPECR
jgi:hypothetical protein